MTSSERLAIVGASYGGLSMADAARRAGWDGPITLISSEPYAPYERPVLSKSFLVPGTEPAAIALRGEPFFARSEIELVTGTTVTGIDLASRSLAIDGAAGLDFRALALATGSKPRRLPIPGADLDGVFSLATLDDALALRERLLSAQSVVVVGAGFIGLEIAATLRTLGKSVDVLEAAPRIMGRALSPVAAQYLEDVHAAEGVRIHTDTDCAAFEGTNARVARVRLASGAVLPADLVIVGVGAVARTDLAQAAGIAVAAGGVRVDTALCTTAPNVYAVGDCASFESPFAPSLGPVRLESVQNATDQGRTAGATVAGAPADYDSVPWFWSEQYGLKLQMVGLLHGNTRTVVRGDPASGEFTLLHVTEDARLVCAESVGRPADHVAARRMVGAPVDVVVAADASVPLRSSVPAMSA